VTIRPLPRSLDPLPGESLPGYILRLAHRLDRAPGRIAILTGLSRQIPGRSATTVPTGRMLHLDTTTAATFAHATRLASQEVAGLCLNSLRDRYPPLDVDYEAAGHRQTNGITGLASWAFTQSTRYCPQCLAGDGSTIQQAHGGAWQKLWHLPPVFACTTHQRLLLHECPQCRQPVHAHRAPGLLPRLQDATLHPAQCRATIGATHWRTQSACGAPLDTSTPSAGAAHPPDPTLAHLLAVQQKIIDLLQPDGGGPAETTSIGQSATAAQYFLDLRLLVGLIRASWPEARHQVESWMNADAVDEHVHQQHQQAKNRRRAGRNYDKPPLGAEACGSLLAFADQMLAFDDPHAARERLAPLLIQASTRSAWVGHFLNAEVYCSDGLQSAIAPQVRALRSSSRPGPKPGPRKPTRNCHFGHQHIPQFLPTDWYEQHFHDLDLTGINPRLLRRVAPLKLVQLAEGGSLDAAAQLLGSPRGRSLSARLSVHRWACGRDETNAAAFAAAVEALACELDATTELIDYGRRRDALTTWSIPLDDWHGLSAELSRQQFVRERATTDWGDRKRRTASVLVWTRITQGEHLIAPLLLADKHTSGRHRTELALDVHQAWYKSRIGRPGQHWVALKRALDAYADQVATDIDSGQTPQSADERSTFRQLSNAASANQRDQSYSA
jgi:hypothetical protein